MSGEPLPDKWDLYGKSYDPTLYLDGVTKVNEGTYHLRDARIRNDPVERVEVDPSLIQGDDRDMAWVLGHGYSGHRVPVFQDEDVQGIFAYLQELKDEAVVSIPRLSEPDISGGHYVEELEDFDVSWR